MTGNSYCAIRAALIMRSHRRHRLVAVLIGIAILLASGRASAHPLLQGSVQLTTRPDGIAIHARVSSEELRVTNALTTPGATGVASGPVDLSACEQHAAYLALHLHVFADGQELPGGVLSVSPPDARAGSDSAEYELLFALVSPRLVHRIELRSDVLADEASLAAVRWEATYVVTLKRDQGQISGGMLLTRTTPVSIPLDSAAGAETEPSHPRLMLAKEYFVHGVHHILTGYDHLLFVSALVLGAATLWDLIKVVTAFTIAHTITLTLATFNVVHMPERVVEPLISASIVLVALQNVFWPERTRGRGRLLVAFFFGLFHGLGFAGGLLEAMQGMQGVAVILALAAFSIGVETGHQMVVLPLFGGLKVARSASARADRQKPWALIQRLGSAGISLAGMFYLTVALRPGTFG